MVVGGVRVTDKYARFRIKSPKSFKRSSIRTQTLSPRVKRLAGRLKTTDEWTTQSLLIDKEAYKKDPKHYLDLVERFR